MRGSSFQAWLDPTPNRVPSMILNDHELQEHLLAWDVSLTPWGLDVPSWQRRDLTRTRHSQETSNYLPSVFYLLPDSMLGYESIWSGQQHQSRKSACAARNPRYPHFQPQPLLVPLVELFSFLLWWWLPGIYLSIN